MVRQFLVLITGIMLFTACNTNNTSETKQTVKTDTAVVASTECETLLKEAKQTDNMIINATNLDKNVAEKAMVAFYNFANICKTDTLAPVFLLKAGQIAQSVGQYTKAEAFFKKCAEEFKDFKNRGAVLFLLAQLYDDAGKLNNEPQAKDLYYQIIREYAKTPFAEDSKAALKNIGKTDEQLIEEFLKKNK